MVLITGLRAIRLTSSEQTFSERIRFSGREMSPLYVRLNFDTSSASAVIDNVAFHNVFPEPSTYTLMLGVVAFVLCHGDAAQKLNGSIFSPSRIFCSS